MKPLLHIVFAKIKRGIKKSIFQSAAVFVSMLVISFFAYFIFAVNTFTDQYPDFGIPSSAGDPITVTALTRFLNKVIQNFIVVTVAVSLLAAHSIYVYCKMNADENKQFYATLTSIGATDMQKQIIATAEAFILYAVPITLGSFLGIIPGRVFAAALTSIFVKDNSLPAATAYIALPLALIGIALVLICTYTPRLGKGSSVIQTVRRHNKKEADMTHSYRSSYTFRSMPIEKRIAKKSVEYYGSSYRRISLMFVSTAMYPILSIQFFSLISETDIVADANPYDGIDMQSISSTLISNIAIFCAIALFTLCIFGVLQIIYMIKTQNNIRRGTLLTYKSIGMTEGSAKKVLKYEYMTVAFNAVLYLIFIVSAMFIVSI